MRGIEGLYAAISAIISEREEENRLALNVSDIVDEVKKEVDVYSASIDWYIWFALRSAVEVGLYQRGYRSVVKGKGLFVNLDNCEKPEYLARMFNNAKLSESQKETVVNLIKKQIKTAGCEGQLSFDINGTIIEDITEEKLLEMLEADAEG